MYGERAIDRRRAATTREIVDAAWVLCRESGLTGLSLRELAARVGMRAPSLYSYFDSKDAIYDAMFADGQRELLAHMAPFVSDADGPVTRRELLDGTRAFFEFCVSDPVRYQLMFQRTIPGFEPSPESFALALEVYGQMVQALTRVGVDDPHLLDLWTAIVAGLVAQQLSNDPGGDRWERLVADAVDMFCDHAGVPPVARDPNRPVSDTTRRRRPG